MAFCYWALPHTWVPTWTVVVGTINGDTGHFQPGGLHHHSLYQWKHRWYGYPALMQPETINWRKRTFQSQQHLSKGCPFVMTLRRHLLTYVAADIFGYNKLLTRDLRKRNDSDTVSNLKLVVAQQHYGYQTSLSDSPQHFIYNKCTLYVC